MEETEEIPYDVRERHFEIVHYDTVGPFISIMLGIYVRCQWDKAGSPIDLDKAHDHVFGNPKLSQAFCEVCLDRFERKRDYQLIFFGRKDKSLLRLREVLGEFH